MADFDDLDMGLDDLDNEIDNMDIGGGNTNLKDNRKPIVKAASNAVAGIKENIKTDGVVKNASKIINSAMPSVLGDKGSDGLKEVTEEVIDSIDEVKEATQKAASPLLKNLKRTLPKDSMFSSFVDKIASVTGIDLDRSSSALSEPSEDDKISASITETFQGITNNLNETQTKMAALSASVADENTKRVLSSQHGIFNVLLYNSRIADTYYRKSIELSYKQLFELKRIVKTQISLNEINVEKLDAIVKNTGLPDAIKLRTSEAVKRQFQANVGESLYQTMISNNDWIQTAKKGIRRKVGNFKNSVVDAFMIGNESLNGYNDMNEMMSGDMLDPEFMTPEQMAAMSKEGILAGQATDFGKTSIGRLIGKRLSKTKIGRRIKSNTDYVMANPYEFAKEKKAESTGIASWLWGLGASVLKPDTMYQDIKINHKAYGINDIAQWDGRSYMTLNSVIPGYLSKMLNELMTMNGKQPTDLKFDYTKRAFRSVSSVTKDLRKELSDEYTQKNVGTRFNTLVDRLENSSDIKLSTKERRKFIKALANHEGPLDVDRIEKQIANGKFIKGLSAKEKMKFTSLIKNAGGEQYFDKEGKLVTDSERRFEVNDMLRSVANSKINARERIERLIEDGFKEPLIKSGIVTYDKYDDSYTIDYDKYNDFNISAMMDAYDNNILHITKSKKESYRNAQSIKKAATGVKETTVNLLNTGKEKAGTFIKDKKIDKYFKEKFGIIKSGAKDIYNGLKGKVEETELYKTVANYLDAQLKPLRDEYVSLKARLKVADGEESIKLNAMLKEVESSIRSIEKEKQYYAKLKAKALKTKKYLESSDAYSVEKDIIKIYGKLKSGAVNIIEDRELDVMYKDITDLSANIASGTKSIFTSMKGKVKDTEVYKQTKEYYDTQTKKLEEKESMLEAAIETLPPEKRSKARRKLKKSRVKIARGRRKAEKELQNISKDTIRTKASETGAQIFGTLKEDMKYTKIKKAAKDGIDKVDVEAGKSGLTGAINKLVNILSPKKKIQGDEDGDGHKDNSWWSILRNRKKEKEKEDSKKTVEKEEKKDESFLTKIFKTLGLTLLPTLIGKMYTATTTAFSILKDIGKSVWGVGKFFGFGEKGMNITSMFTTFAKYIGTSMAASSLMSGGFVSKLIGHAFTMLGMKKVGDFFKGAGKAANESSKKMMKGKSVFSKLLNVAKRHKGKLLLATAAAGMFSATQSEASDDFELPDINLHGAEKSKEEDSVKETGDDNSAISMGTDIATAMAGTYVVDKVIDKVVGAFKKKDPKTKVVEEQAKKSATGATKWLSNKIKLLKNPKVAKRIAKMGIKKIPGIGLVASLGTSIADMAAGKYKSAGLGVLSGLLSMIPVVGTVASIGVDMYADEPSKIESKQEIDAKDLRASQIADDILANEKQAESNKKINEGKVLKDRFDAMVADKGVVAENTYKSKKGKASITFYKKDNKIVGRKIVNAEGKVTAAINVNGKLKTFDYDVDKQQVKPLKTIDYTKKKPHAIEKTEVGNAVVHGHEETTASTQPPKIIRKIITKGDRVLLEFISNKESSKGDRGYNMVVGNVDIGNKKLTEMTILEIYKLQSIIKSQYKKSGAVGKYQFVPITLKETVSQSKNLGITNKTLFTPLTQDVLIKQRLINKRKYDQWKLGNLSDVEFAYELAKEFASIKVPGTNHGYYDATTSNVGTVNSSAVIDTLVKVREIDGCKSHPDNVKHDTSKIAGEHSKTKQGQNKQSQPATVSGPMAGLKMAINAVMEFFGAEAPTSLSTQPARELEDAEGRPTVNMDSTVGNLNKTPIELPGGVDAELCGIKAKRLSALAFGKAVAMANNRHFKGGKAEYLMVHNTAGSSLYLGRMKKDGYGTQLWIDKSGAVTIIGDITQIYYHVGPVKPEWKGKVSSYNTIGIEMVCAYKNGEWEPYTEAQKKALLQVGSCIMKKFGIDRDHILYHEQVSYKTKDEGRIGAMMLKGVDVGDSKEPDQVVSKQADVSANVAMPRNQHAKKELDDAEGIKHMVVNKTTSKKNKDRISSLSNSTLDIIDPSADILRANNDLLDLGYKRLNTLESIEKYMKIMAEKDNATIHHHYDENKKIIKTEKIENENKKTFDVIEKDKEPKIKLK